MIEETSEIYFNTLYDICKKYHINLSSNIYDEHAEFILNIFNSDIIDESIINKAENDNKGLYYHILSYYYLYVKKDKKNSEIYNEKSRMRLFSRAFLVKADDQNIDYEQRIKYVEKCIELEPTYGTAYYLLFLINVSKKPYFDIFTSLYQMVNLITSLHYLIDGIKHNSVECIVIYHVTFKNIIKKLNISSYLNIISDYNNISNLNNFEIKELIKKCDYFSQYIVEYFLHLVENEENINNII
jgi:hypothetical protein